MSLGINFLIWLCGFVKFVVYLFESSILRDLFRSLPVSVMSFLLFVFLWMSQAEILKNWKNTYFATNFSKSDIFRWKLVTWSIFRFYIFLFFSKSTSVALIPWDLYLHFCTWQAHFWSNIRESVKIFMLNNSNLWKNFEEHFSEHFRYHIFQIITLKKIISFIR